MHDNNVIAAIATGYAVSAIGIVRVSGNGSFELLKNIFTKKPPFEHRKIYYGYIKDSNDKIVDEVLVSIFKSPNSYTGEDSFEINCHGGLTVLSGVLEVVFEAGARIAQPGEFTKRAFLNGKMDLSQAEAVEKIISSKSKRALMIAQRQLQGKFSSKIDKIREQILFLMAENEVVIDHPDEELISTSTEDKTNVLTDMQNQLRNILKSAEYGDVIFDGMVLAIIGKPNVGKSSLINILMGTERSIVTEIPGTTRDVVSGRFNIGGIPCTILDTAGIRNTEDKIESLGIERSRKAIKDADIILALFDASVGFDKEDHEILNYIKKSTKNIIGVINKIDIKSHDMDIPLKNVIEISCKTHDGIDVLEKTIISLVMGNIDDSELVSLNVNQKNSLKAGIQICAQLINDIKSDIDPALIGVDFISLADSLDEVLGRITNEDMLDVMFKKFCIGK